MSPVVSIGRSAAVIYLVSCDVLQMTSAIRFLLTMTTLGVMFALACGFFIFCVSVAAWHIFYWKPEGRFLGFFVVLQWFGALVNGHNLGTVTYILSVPMAALGIWLLLPEVKEQFRLQKVVA